VVTSSSQNPQPDCLSTTAYFDFRRGVLGIGGIAFGAPWPFARVTLTPEYLLLQTRGPLRHIGQALDLQIQLDEITRVRRIPTGVAIYVDERVFPLRLRIWILGRRKQRRYSYITILILRKSMRRSFVQTLESRLQSMKASE